ncbi:TolB family protein, partial [Ancylomarina sp.]|uniref:TolB family protein n=1 Tax=Ancylomarina sp. TaxID=1970196 RepID=UPI003564A883
YKNNKLLWSESQAHLRWQHADKAVIVSYDIRTGNKKKYKLEKNCFAPVFSADGKNILAVEVDSKGESSLLIIDEASGKSIHRIAAKKHEFFMTPQWAKNDQSIVLIVQARGEKSLVEIDLNSENRKLLYQAGTTNISQPQVSDKYVFFTSSHTGIDNIFAYEWESGQVSQLTSSRFGARDPYYHQAENKLYYSDYSSDGYKPIKLDLNSCMWKEQEGTQVEFTLAEQLSDQLGEKLQPDTTKLGQWEVEPYSRLAHTFNFHSWAPLFISPDEEKMDIGISASSQNLLNTFFTTVGYKKEEGYDQGQFYLNLSYQRFFPIFNSKLEYGKPSLDYMGKRKNRNTEENDILPLNTEWKQLEWENSVTLPFNLSSGKHATFLRPKFSYNIYQFTEYQIQISSPEFDPQSYNLSIENRKLDELEYQLFLSHSIKASQRDLQSPWAQFLQVDYRHSPSKEFNAGNVWSGICQFYFPGFVKHHGISFYAGYQNRSELNTIFGNSIKSPRGVSSLYGLDCSTMSLDYRMPLAYPDWNLGGLAYIKRVKMGAFVDYGMEQGHFVNTDNLRINFDNRITSVGLEFTADMHVLRLPIPLNLGFRLGYEN